MKRAMVAASAMRSWRRARRSTAAAALALLVLGAGLIPSRGLAREDSSANAGNLVQQENGREGTTTWQLSNPADNRQIEGYASLTSVPVGGDVDLFVNTKDATYALTVYRMGWYGGRGGRKVLGPTHLNGVQQVTPAADPTTGRIECHWTNPYHLHIPTSWVSGIYLVKLHGKNSGKESYITFTVRDSRAADVVFQQSVTTYQAYNPWPGYDASPGADNGGYVGGSLYEGQTKTVFGNHADGTLSHQALEVSFDRPYGRGLETDTLTGVGAGDFLTHDFAIGGGLYAKAIAAGGTSAWEFGMLRWLERNGYDVTYITNVDTHEDLSRLVRGKVFLSVGHDEYWTLQMRHNIVTARDQGLSLAFLSANYMYWPIELLPDSGQSANRTISVAADTKNGPDVQYRKSCDFACNPESEQAVVGGMWDGPGHQGNGDIVVPSDAPLDHWVFANTGLKVGDVVPGLIGYEYNIVNSAYRTPSAMQTLLHTQAPDFRAEQVKNVSAGGGIPLPANFDGKSFDSWYDTGGTADTTCHQDPIAPLKIVPIDGLCSNPWPQAPGQKQDWAMTLYQAGSRAWVFNAATVQWSWGLDDYGTGIKTPADNASDGEGSDDGAKTHGTINGPALRTQCGYPWFHPSLVSCQNPVIEQITSNVLSRLISGH